MASDSSMINELVNWKVASMKGAGRGLMILFPGLCLEVLRKTTKWVSRCTLWCFDVPHTVIQLHLYEGRTPRLGALYVCPSVPVRVVTEEKRVSCAREICRLLASELHVPVYLYGAATSRAYRKTLT